MEEKTVLVVAKESISDGVFCYSAYMWHTGEDGKGTYGNAWAYDLHRETYRTIRFDVRKDLSWRAGADEVCDCRYERWNGGPYETPEIASDDVGNDMLEVALAAAWPTEYSEHNRKLEEEALRMEAESLEAEKARTYNRSM